MRALLLPAIGLVLTATGVLHGVARQPLVDAESARTQDPTQPSDGLRIAWASFVYSSNNVDAYDVFGGGCPTPDNLPGRVAVGIHNGDLLQVAEGVQVRITLHDEAGGSIDEGIRIIPQVLAGEERAAVFSTSVSKRQRRIIGARAEIVGVDAWRPGMPLAGPEAHASMPGTLFGDPIRSPRGTPPDPCNRPFSLNFVQCNISNASERSFVNVTVTIIGFNDQGQTTGFGVQEVPYMPPGSSKLCGVTWSGQLRTTAVKVYANYPLNNPPPLEPQSSP